MTDCFSCEEKDLENYYTKDGKHYCLRCIQRIVEGERLDDASD